MWYLQRKFGLGYFRFYIIEICYSLWYRIFVTELVQIRMTAGIKCQFITHQGGTAPLDLIFEDFVYFLKKIKELWTKYPMYLIRKVRGTKKAQSYFSRDQCIVICKKNAQIVTKLVGVQYPLIVVKTKRFGSIACYLWP